MRCFIETDSNFDLSNEVNELVTGAAAKAILAVFGHTYEQDAGRQMCDIVGLITYKVRKRYYMRYTLCGKFRVRVSHADKVVCRMKDDRPAGHNRGK